MALAGSIVPRLLTVDEFDRAWAAGVYGPEERLELVDGEVICKLSPQESPHATAISLVVEALRQRCMPASHVRAQLPLALGEYSKPEPDVVVVEGHIRDYAEAHPTSALLVVEVGDSTLAFDRTRKAELYARYRLPEFWIVNLVARQLEVYRNPVQAGDGTARYDLVFIVSADEGISPEFAPDATIAVADLLP